MKSVNAWLATKKIKMELEVQDELQRAIILVNIWVNLRIFESAPNSPFKDLLTNIFIIDGKISTQSKEAYQVFCNMLYNQHKQFVQMVNTSEEYLEHINEFGSSHSSEELQYLQHHYIHLKASTHAAEIILWSLCCLTNNTNLDNLKNIWMLLDFTPEIIQEAITFRRKIIDKVMEEEEASDPDFEINISPEILKELCSSRPKFIEYI